MEERFLVTGANGCIGAWVVHQLADEGVPVVALDLAEDLHRLRMLVGAEALERVVRVRVDVSDLAAVERVLDEHGITRIVHLAALQVPFCRADPPLGALVNVVGTVNVLEAAARRRDAMGHVVYASSIAAYDPAGGMERLPATIYGVYKRADEGCASVYHAERGLVSVGLRPHTVFGPGRDQGLTSAPTAAMLAAAAGAAYHIPYGGGAQMQYAPDVARAFVAAARASVEGAAVHNLPGESVAMPDVIAAIAAAAPASAGRITAAAEPLDFPARADSASFTAAIGPVAQTPFRGAVAETVTRFAALLAEGRIALAAPA